MIETPNSLTSLVASNEEQRRKLFIFSSDSSELLIHSHVKYAHSDHENDQ